MKFKDEIEPQIFFDKMDVFYKVIGSLIEKTNEEFMTPMEIIAKLDLVEKPKAEIKFLSINEILFYNEINQTNVRPQAHPDVISFFSQKAILVDKITYSLIKSNPNFWTLNVRYWEINKYPKQNIFFKLILEKKLGFKNCKIMELPLKNPPIQSKPFSKTIFSNNISVRNSNNLLERNSNNLSVRNSNNLDISRSLVNFSDSPRIDESDFLTFLENLVTHEVVLQTVETTAWGFMGLFTCGATHFFLRPSQENNYRPITYLIENISSHL